MYICLFNLFKNKKISNIKWGGKRRRSRLDITFSDFNIYITIYICIYMYIYIHVYMYILYIIRIGVYIYIFIFQLWDFRIWCARWIFQFIYIYIYIYMYIYIYICLFKHFKNKKISNIKWGGKTGRSRLDILSVWKHYLLRLWNTQKIRDFVTRTASSTW